MSAILDDPQQRLDHPLGYDHGTDAEAGKENQRQEPAAPLWQPQPRRLGYQLSLLVLEAFGIVSQLVASIYSWGRTNTNRRRSSGDPSA